ncbi:agmatine deiminase family protein [Streptomonospora halophila]|uniref:Agmatine deiminase family protein n=1 Tax=Streptomonospora halophila TaxID=427369 RepID=A0ABP9GQE3_9ACTN
MPTPRPLMPAETARHERTWLAFPPPNDTFGEEGAPTLEQARRRWADVANTVARYEPVTVVAGIGQGAAAKPLLAPSVTVVELPLDDAWMRDSGPTFVRDPLSPTGLGAVDWVFNGWGAQSWAGWERDDHVAGQVAALAGCPAQRSRLTTEGGGFHVDGEGTVLLTETVQLDPDRNPGWSAADVEAEVHTRLGTTKAIWLPRGLTRDYDEFGTRGHVDMVATFVRPGTVAVHMQTHRAHPDYDVTGEIAELLRDSTDAEGRTLEVIEVAGPTVLEDGDGRPVDYSYINHYVANGVVVLGAFDDPHDARAADVLAAAYPDRAIELVDAREIFASGGGVHCITQQQPAGPPVDP